MLVNFVLVGFGAALGAMLRYGISVLVKSKWKTNFPFATFFINITGSFLLGFLVSSALGPVWQLFFRYRIYGEDIRLFLRLKWKVWN